MKNTFAHKISLGQNFLTSPEVPRRAVEAGKLSASDCVLEVGCGQGILTRQLLESPAACVHAVEIDTRLEPWLTPLAQEFGERFRLNWGDAMRFDLARLSPVPNKILANIPYNITSDLIEKCLRELAPLGLERMLLLVQKEAAMRLSAPPRTKDRGPLGITIELMGGMRKIMDVSPGSFNPPPKVWSSLIAVDVTQNVQLAASPDWRRLMSAAFSRRRRKLTSNLAPLCEKDRLAVLFEALAISLDARAEELTGEQWIKLYTELFTVKS